MAQLPTLAELQVQIEVCRADFFAARKSLMGCLVPVSSGSSTAEVADHLLAGAAEYDPAYVMKHVSTAPTSIGLDPLTDMAILRPLLERATELDREFESLVVLREDMLGHKDPARVYPHMGREFTFDAANQRIVFRDLPGRDVDAVLEQVPNRAAPTLAKARSRGRDR